MNQDAPDAGDRSKAPQEEKQRTPPPRDVTASVLNIIKSVLWLGFGTLGIVFILLNWSNIKNSLSNLDKLSGFGFAVELRSQLSSLPLANPAEGRKGYFLSQEQPHTVFTRATWSMPALAGATILWVDDEPENNNNVMEFFQWARILVRIARSNDDAMKQLVANKIDLVISDVGRRHEPNYFLSPLLRCPIHFFRLPSWVKSDETVNALNVRENREPAPGFSLAERMVTEIPDDKRPPLIYMTGYGDILVSTCAVLTTGNHYELIHAVISELERRRTGELARIRPPWVTEAFSASKK